MSEDTTVSQYTPCKLEMTKVRDFVAGLARAGKGKKEIKTTVDLAFPDKSLSESQINRIIRAVKLGENTEDRRKESAKKTVRTMELVAAVSAAIKEDRRLSVSAIAQATGASEKTIHRILTEDLGLVKKSARWVPKLLSQEQKEERVRTSKLMKKLVFEKGEAVLGKIITMDESAVSF